MASPSGPALAALSQQQVAWQELRACADHGCQDGEERCSWARIRCNYAAVFWDRATYHVSARVATSPDGSTRLEVAVATRDEESTYSVDSDGRILDNGCAKGISPRK